MNEIGRDIDAPTKVGRLERLKPQLAIVAIGVFVGLYDAICKPGNMISEEVDRLRESPVTGKLTNWALDTLYNHLKRSVPPEQDPIHKLAQLFDKD